MPGVGLADHHAGPLLHGYVPPAPEHGCRHHQIVDRIAAVLELHLIGEIHGGGRGACICQQVSRLHIVRAEGPVGPEIPLDHRHVIILPQAVQLLPGHVQGNLAVLHLEDLHPQLLHADQEIIRHRVPAVERPAVLRHVRRLAVRPLIVRLRRRGDALHGLQIRQGEARGRRKGLPVRLVEHHDLRGLGRGEYPQGAVGGDAPFLDVGVHVLRQLLLVQVLRQVGQGAGLLHLIGRIRVGGEQVRHGVRPHLSANGVPHRSLQVGYGALAVALYINPQLPARRFVEFLHQCVKGRLLGTVIVMPYRQGDRIPGIQRALVPASCQAQDSRQAQAFHKQALDKSIRFSHMPLPSYFISIFLYPYSVSTFRSRRPPGKSPAV